MDPSAAADPASLNQAFAVWAAVVGIIGAALVYELARVSGELKSMSFQLNAYIVSMERRVTTIETHLRIHQPGFKTFQFNDGDN